MSTTSTLFGTASMIVLPRCLISLKSAENKHCTKHDDAPGSSWILDSTASEIMKSMKIETSNHSAFHRPVQTAADEGLHCAKRLN